MKLNDVNEKRKHNKGYNQNERWNLKRKKEKKTKTPTQ
jgi:hypothetical protein